MSDAVAPAIDLRDGICDVGTTSGSKRASEGKGGGGGVKRERKGENASRLGRFARAETTAAVSARSGFADPWAEEVEELEERRGVVGPSLTSSRFCLQPRLLVKVIKAEHGKERRYRTTTYSSPLTQQTRTPPRSRERNATEPLTTTKRFPPRPPSSSRPSLASSACPSITRRLRGEVNGKADQRK